MIKKGETLVVQTRSNYVLAAQLYDDCGAEKIESFRHLTSEPICYLLMHPQQIKIIAQEIKPTYYLWITKGYKPVYLILNANESHRQLTGEKIIFMRFVHFDMIKQLTPYGILKTIVLPQIPSSSIEDELQSLYHNYQHITQTIIASDEIKPTHEKMSIIDFTQGEPKVIQQGDAKIENWPWIK